LLLDSADRHRGVTTCFLDRDAPRHLCVDMSVEMELELLVELRIDALGVDERPESER
jgi:hypothetical protein